MPLFSLHPKEKTEELFGRENEIEELVRLIRAKRWVAILGPRMVGKTSLVKATNKNWKAWALKQFMLTFGVQEELMAC